MAEDIVKLLCRPGSPIILVFDPQAPEHSSKGNLFSGDTKYKGVGKFCSFRLKSFISNTVQDRPMIAMER